MINIAVLGYGTIGSGVVEAIDINQPIIAKNAGDNVQVKYVLARRDYPGLAVQDKIIHDMDIILNDPEVSIVVEVIGGTSPAYEYAKSALLAGKSVCTANKNLVAAHGPELIQIAKEKQVSFLFEASVGGGIPIIRPILRSLTVDNIYEITGILNGTTNFILTKMFEDGADYADVLKEAQDLGYAEADPSADVDGWDAARKISILSSLMYGKNVDYEKFTVEGISGITSTDMAYVKSLGRKVKLLGITYNIDNEIYVEVAPHIIDSSNVLFGVDGVKNGIQVKGNLLGDTMFYGAGAGKLPTASAVVSDIIDAAMHAGKNIPINWSAEPVNLARRGKHWSRFFIRADKEYEELKDLFKLEQLITLPDFPDEYAIITGQVTFDELNEKLGDRKHIRNVIQVK